MKKTMNMYATALRSKALSLMALTAMACLATPTRATETGGSSYPLGTDTINPGMMLPEGAHVLAQYQHFEASHVKNDAGADNSRVAYYKVKSDALSMRLSYVWSGVRWLGATVETRAVLPLVSVDLSLGLARPGTAGPLDRSGSSGGLGDMLLAPVLLGWHGPELHQIAGIETFVPIGKFDKNATVNIGRNYWQVAPSYAVTWMPGRWQLSGKARYGVNSKNTDTDYKSGNELSLEYSAGYGVLPGMVVGINGYVYRQTSNDQQGGLAVNGNGNRGHVNAIGPYIGYQISPKAAVMLKLQAESGAHNRAEGTRLWVHAKIPF